MRMSQPRMVLVDLQHEERAPRLGAKLGSIGTLLPDVDKLALSKGEFSYVFGLLTLILLKAASLTLQG